MAEHRSDNENYKVTCVYGRVELQSRMRPVGDRIIGEGRSLRYDWYGKLVEITPWVPTGIELY